jgi:hypothetical protein
MHKKPKTKPAAVKLEFPSHGYVLGRKDAIKSNRKPEEKRRFERDLQRYVEVVRRQFRQGFFWSAGMWCAINERERYEKDFRTGERMEAFEANRAAERKSRKVATRG